MTREQVVQLIDKTEQELVVIKKELSNASSKYKKSQKVLNQCYKDLYQLTPPTPAKK